MAILLWSQLTRTGNISRRESRSRMPSWKASTDGCVDELLNETLFLSLDHARELLAEWQDDYNTVRPHRDWQPAALHLCQTNSVCMQQDGRCAVSKAPRPRPAASPSRTGSNEKGIPPMAG